MSCCIAICFDLLISKELREHNALYNIGLSYPFLVSFTSCAFVSEIVVVDTKIQVPKEERA